MDNKVFVELAPVQMTTFFMSKVFTLVLCPIKKFTDLGGHFH